MDDRTPKRPPGRPRSFDPTEALETAMLLFWRHGYEGVSIAQLTDAMGIKSASLYAAFGSKEQLYRKALQHYLGGLGRIGVSSLATSPTAREGIALVLREAAKAFTRPDYPPGCMVGIGALRCGVENQIAADETAALRKLSQLAIVQRLDRAKSEREIAGNTNINSLAAFFVAVVEGLSVQAQDGADRESLLQIGELAMKAWPRGG